ncbi:cupin, partial [Halorubrum sp. E3]
MSELDVRQLPPSERHDRIRTAFADLDPGETLTVVNDHEPTPLYRELAAEEPAFDADGYAVEREEASRFVAEFPKVEPASGPETVRLAGLDGEPHAAVFPGREPKTVRLSLDAGESVPEHTHPDRTVLFHALSGAFALRLDGEQHAVEAGE